MVDLLVNLFEIPSSMEAERLLLDQGIRVNRALAPDRSSYIATREKELVGFACYEATAKDFFGPMAVRQSERRRGIGRVLLLKSLESMKEMGYAYAIIGWPAKSSIPFYENCVRAVPVGGTSHGIYRQMIEIDR